MLELIVWDKPSKLSKRIYRRDLIVDRKEYDINIINLNSVYRKVGTCEIIKNDVGVYATNINYTCNYEYLMSLLRESHNTWRNREYDTFELVSACGGYVSSIKDDSGTYYDEVNNAKFLFGMHQLFTYDDMDIIYRDIKLNSLTNQ